MLAPGAADDLFVGVGYIVVFVGVSVRLYYSLQLRRMGALGSSGNRDCHRVLFVRVEGEGVQRKCGGCCHGSCCGICFPCDSEEMTGFGCVC